MMKSKSEVLKKQTVISFGKEDVSTLLEEFNRFVETGEVFEVELESSKMNETVIVTVELGEE